MDHPQLFNENNNDSLNVKVDNVVSLCKTIEIEMYNYSNEIISKLEKYYKETIIKLT